jgi:hypothetical protein
MTPRLALSHLKCFFWSPLALSVGLRLRLRCWLLMLPKGCHHFSKDVDTVQEAEQECSGTTILILSLSSSFAACQHRYSEVIRNARFVAMFNTSCQRTSCLSEANRSRRCLMRFSEAATWGALGAAPSLSANSVGSASFAIAASI